ncbi:bifunctional phosphopantothenoylcysteine decarboxylase/phosphopantothenate--cysteine ligase CoaBC [Streptomyces sp. NBC_01803]|uniref:bifunctional phosphopantothenoylcysteine decarboxylase/phosphopantothenate--cysteine ligase CoaBC n=1 Tax=Streptomyces sp. NBC_01803 TaxID=2975946 RepID=UPI002DDAF4E5|nr:bifunctional phosphopantothenoylcysteine decarboxylase/phosphopantothenate--cysteine ligase CoaBC [Streptomyces sp. NBC_01803]WSA47187.1 bifunctional phosphopantothenoylcysteine decarboxylase/phosphopantothenate--cysteine ligase CoaBC [Streptomyces sp. NBC_01803]
MEQRPRVVLGVGGGIAAYKACELLRRLTESGHEVRVVPTASALHFVGAATWAALSGAPVATEVWDDVHEVPHVRIGQRADLVVIAPATADVLARAAGGRADDLLTNVLLTARCPVVFAPAMHTEMWEHPATQENVATLRRRGCVVVEPAVGRLTGVDTGKGRLPDPEAIFEVCRRVLDRGARALDLDLAGRHVVISAGGTREPLDPVRYLGNRSSGKQGYALARTAVARGARVTLVAANTALPDPAGADLVRVGTAEELRGAVLKAAADADAVVMAAAVADFRPAAQAGQKIKKRDGREPEPVALVRNPDILAELSAARPAPGQIVVGFAAETENVLANGRAKIARKGCDLLVVNQVGEGLAFGTEENEAVILDAAGGESPVPHGPKEALADRVWDAVARHWSD